MTVYAFAYTDWSKLFPEFGNGNVDEPTANLYFGVAQRFVANYDASRVPCDATTFEPRRTILLYTTAHIAKLSKPQPDGTVSPLIGRISQGAEGSVNVSTEMEVPKGAEWWAQSQYGLMAWQLQAPFRTARYRHRRRGLPPNALQMPNGAWVWPQ